VKRRRRFCRWTRRSGRLRRRRGGRPNSTSESVCVPSWRIGENCAKSKHELSVFDFFIFYFYFFFGVKKWKELGEEEEVEERKRRGRWGWLPLLFGFWMKRNGQKGSHDLWLITSLHDCKAVSILVRPLLIYFPKINNQKPTSTSQHYT